MEEPDVGIAITFGATTLRDRANEAEPVLEKLYDGYAQPLFRYALALLASPEDAEDAVQEVFVRIARERRRLGKIGNIKAYLFAATRNAAYSMLRRQKRMDKLNEAACSDFLAKSASRSTGRSEELCEAFAKLPVEQREVLVLKAFDEMTFKEIAETIGTSINTAAGRYRYGIARLRQALEEDR